MVSLTDYDGLNFAGTTAFPFEPVPVNWKSLAGCFGFDTGIDVAYSMSNSGPPNVIELTGNTTLIVLISVPSVALIFKIYER